MKEKYTIKKANKDDLIKLAKKIKKGDFIFLAGNPDPNIAIRELGLDPNEIDEGDEKDAKSVHD